MSNVGLPIKWNLSLCFTGKSKHPGYGPACESRQRLLQAAVAPSEVLFVVGDGLSSRAVHGFSSLRTDKVAELDFSSSEFDVPLLII